MTVQIYAGNLPYTLSDENLKDLFEKHGEVGEAKIIRDRETGRSRGFGFIEMNNGDEAEIAILELNGFDVSGRNIKVNVARPRRR